MGLSNPYPTSPPEDPNNQCTEYDGEHVECEMSDDFDDQSNESSESGSIPRNTLYVNGFEVNQHDVMMNSEFYENDPGAFRLFRNNATGEYSFGLNTNTGYYKPQFSNNQVVVDGKSTRYKSSFEGFKFIADENSAPHGPSEPVERPSDGPSQDDVGCAQKMALLFGAEGAVSSAGEYDVATLTTGNKNYNDGLRYPQGPEAGLRGNLGHGATPYNENTTPAGTTERGGVVHIYPNAEGHLQSGAKVPVFVPSGFNRITKLNGLILPSGRNNVQYFHNPQLGVYMTMAHVDTRRVLFGSQTNDTGSKLLGYFVTRSGKFGGSSDGYYIHTHISFFSKFDGSLSGGTRTDPRQIFCK